MKKLKCIVTGREKSFSKFTLKKKIDKFGSVEEYSKYYVCKEAKKLLKKGKTIQEVREALNCSSDLPDPDLEILFKLKLIKNKRVKSKEKTERENYLSSKEFKQKKLETGSNFIWGSRKQYIEWATGGPDKCHVPMGGTCQRPDIHIKNGYYCDGCEFYEFCLCSQKRVRKY